MCLVHLFLAINGGRSEVVTPEESIEYEEPHFLPVEESAAAQDSEESATNDLLDVPPEVRTVSKFIQEFHVSVKIY